MQFPFCVRHKHIVIRVSYIKIMTAYSKYGTFLSFDSLCTLNNLVRKRIRFEDFILFLRFINSFHIGRYALCSQEMLMIILIYFLWKSGLPIHLLFE